MLIYPVFTSYQNRVPIMSDLFLIIKEFNTNYPNLVTWLAAGSLVLLGLLSQSLWIKECISEWKLNNLLKNIGIESLHNVTVADDMDGKIFIEYLILLPNKILLIGVKKYRGLIFAAEKIDLWTQVIGNKSYKFENPLRQLESAVLFLNSKIKSKKIEERVLFIKGSEFPKGKPEDVLTISELKKMSATYSNLEVPQALRTDWDLLSELAINNDFEKNKNVLVDEVSDSRLNKFSLFITLVFLSVWLGWRLF